MFCEAHFTQAVNRKVNMLVWVVFPGSLIRPNPTSGNETAETTTEETVSLQFLLVLVLASQSQ